MFPAGPPCLRMSSRLFQRINAGVASAVPPKRVGGPPSSEDMIRTDQFSLSSESSLYPLVQYLWSIPASSACAERLFSFLGHLLTRAPQRSPATLQQLALLRDYQKQPSYDFEQLMSYSC